MNTTTFQKASLSLIVLGSLLGSSIASARTFIECGTQYNSRTERYADFRMAAASVDDKFKGYNSGTFGTGWQFTKTEGKWMESESAVAKYEKRKDTLTITVIGHGGRYTFYTIEKMSSATPTLNVTQLSGRVSPVGTPAECIVLKD